MYWRHLKQDKAGFINFELKYDLSRNHLKIVIYKSYVEIILI